MNNIEKEFFEGYKKLDKLCREIFDSDQGVSEYIRQMEATPYYETNNITIWERDYKKLKHFRWLRNAIAHNDYESECTYDDIEDVIEFRERILNQRDPFALISARKETIRKNPPLSHESFDNYNSLFNDDSPIKQKDIKNQRPNWSTAKLIIGLISILGFVFMMFQSCAAGVYSTFMKTGEVSGAFGVICATLMLIAAIIMLATRKKVSKGAVIADVIIYFLVAFLSYNGASGYPDLVFWGGLALAFAGFYLGSYIAEAGVIKQKYVIILVIIYGLISLTVSLLLSYKFSIAFESNQQLLQDTLNNAINEL